MSKSVLLKLALFVLHDGICGSFYNKATINASALLCVLWQNLDEDSFDMLYKKWLPSLTQYERPIYHMKKKIDMLSSTDNNFMICLFDLERFSIESRFPFCLNSLCILRHTSLSNCVNSELNSLYDICPSHMWLYRSTWLTVLAHNSFYASGISFADQFFHSVVVSLRLGHTWSKQVAHLFTTSDKFSFGSWLTAVVFSFKSAKGRNPFLKHFGRLEVFDATPKTFCLLTKLDCMKYGL